MIRFIYFLLAGLFFIAGTQVIIGEINLDNFHPKDTDCQQCHLARNTITADNASQLLSTQEQLCSRCHENSLKVSHPSGFNPGRDIPGDFPLDWKNEITCSTCHNIHADEHASIRGGISGKALCLSCHDMSFFRAMANNGLSIRHDTQRETAINTAFPADSHSTECMLCHATQADTKGISINKKGIVKHTSGAVSHPIGTAYTDAYARRGYRVIPEKISNAILVDGKLSCISCHRDHIKKHDATIKRTSKTTSCFECHEL